MKNVAFELNHDNLFCPVTGIDIMEDTDKILPSPAMKFIYLQEINEFITDDQNLEKMYESCLGATEDEDYEEALQLLFEKLQNQKNWICMEVTTFGMACGPISSTGYFCFDMDYQVK
jgi:hypothetical protein